MKNCSILFFAIFLFSIHSTLLSQPGSFNNDFGNNGHVVIESTSDEDLSFDIVKIGDHLYSAGVVGKNFTVYSFNLDGTPNNSYAENGVFKLNIESSIAEAHAILPSPDGDLLIGGYAKTGSNSPFVVVKMDVNGTLDQDFGENGIAMGQFGGSTYAAERIYKLEQNSEGRIYFAGIYYTGITYRAYVASLNSDGSINSDFGDEGIVVLDTIDGYYTLAANGLAIDHEDNVIIGGALYSGDYEIQDGYFITKLKSNGTKDTTFGTDGAIVYFDEAHIRTDINDILIDNNNRILTGGALYNWDEFESNIYLTRWNSDGSPDITFDEDGILSLNYQNRGFIYDLALDPDGNIIAAGDGNNLLMTRIRNNGVLDESFGNNGWSSTKITDDLNALRSIFLSDGHIYVSGFTGGNNLSFFVADYINNQLESGISELTFNDISFNIYPNPTDLAINIQLQLSKDELMEIYLINASGKKIGDVIPRQIVHSGDNTFSFSFPAGTPSGLYFTVIKAGEKSIIKKINFQTNK